MKRLVQFLGALLLLVLGFPLLYVAYLIVSEMHWSAQLFAVLVLLLPAAVLYVKFRRPNSDTPTSGFLAGNRPQKEGLL